jgi:hypothetical protein
VREKREEESLVRLEVSLLSMLPLLRNWKMVLLHDGGYFCNGCITKRCLQKEKKMDLFHNRFTIRYLQLVIRVLKCFCDLNNIGFILKGELLREKLCTNLDVYNCPVVRKCSIQLSAYLGINRKCYALMPRSVTKA